MKRSMLLRLLFSVLLPAGNIFSAAGQLKLPAVFADNMVLQRRMSVPVWGWANPGDTVTITLNGNKTQAIADATGYWIGYLLPMEAQSAGKDLVIAVSGLQPLIIRDVLVGEVWLCSGQSNMRMEMMYRNEAIPGVEDWENEVQKAHYPLIRFYNRFRGKGTDLWEKCDSGSVKLFSAVAWYFGSEIFRELKVPVGLIHQSAGGTSIQKWVPGSGLSELPWARQYLLYSQYIPWQEPAACYNKFIAPLVPYGIRGVLWYQGESNSNTYVHGYSYRYLLPLLVQSWRKEWKRPDLPFAFVQLPIWEKSTAFRFVREAQLNTVKTVPLTGMVTTCDQDAFRTMLHPRNKKFIGQRLATWAKASVYGRKAIRSMGPVYRSYKKEGNAIKIYFDGPVKSCDGKPLRGFEIAGHNKKFYPAVAAIAAAGTLLISNPGVRDPAAVRYLWGENILPGNLSGIQGLPASPFRTDTWGNDTLEKQLLSGSELNLVYVKDRWTANAGAINKWMPATPPAASAITNNGNSVRISVRRNNKGGIQSPFLMEVDLSRNPVIKLNRLRLETARSWSLVLMTPDKKQYVLKEQVTETGNVTADIAACLKQICRENREVLQGTQDIVVLLYVNGNKKNGSMLLDSIEVAYTFSK